MLPEPLRNQCLPHPNSAAPVHDLYDDDIQPRNGTSRPAVSAGVPCAPSDYRQVRNLRHSARIRLSLSGSACPGAAGPTTLFAAIEDVHPKHGDV
jgi:hypothetical protein